MDVQKSLADATEAMRHGSLAEAEHECRIILAIFPRHYRALMLLGEILSRAGKEAEARAAYDCAEMSKPGATFRFTQVAIERFRATFGPSVPARRETVQNRRRAQMRSLGQNGRFGNQLLQYAFVRLYAQQHDLVAEFPDWIGRDIFDFADPFPSAKLPSLNESDADLFGSLVGRTGRVFPDRDINGYFVGNTREWGAWRSEFCTLYAPGQKVEGLLARARHNLRSRGKTVVAIHLRHGDFGYGRYWVAPSGWYLAWLRTIWANLQRPVLYIASDLPGPHLEFANFNPLSADQLDVHIPGVEFLIDHYMLRHADYLAISNSSFSFTAAMLNARARSFLRPEPNRQELVAFDPWASDVLLDAMVEPRAIGYHERLLIQHRLLPTDTVVYWGGYCSAWTNFARSVHSRLRIFETEADACVTDTLHRRNIRHVRLLVLANMDIQSRFIKSADAVFDQAQVDMVLLRLGRVPNANVVLREFSAIGYRVFHMWKNQLLRVAPHESNVRGSYLAVRHDLATTLQSRGSPLYLRARNLLQRLYGWQERRRECVEP
jgi:hypothetical protein